MLPLDKQRALERIIAFGGRLRYLPAIQQPGPAYKTNGGVNSVRGVVCHSMVGGYAGALARLESADRASWHFSVCQDGTVYQHYDPSAQAWHAGSSYNNFTVGIEHEGGYSPEDEPLTVAQRDASVALVRWLSKTYGFVMTRHDGMWEHHEVSGAPTACPSNRIPWQFYTTEEESMPTAEYAELKQADLDIEKTIVSIQDRLREAFIARLLELQESLNTALAALATANAGSFKSIEERLTKLEAK